MLRDLSTQNRLVLVGLMATLPMLAVTAYGAFAQRAQAEVDAKENLQRLVKLAARYQEQVVRGARDTLVAVAQLASALPRDPAVCSKEFSDLLERSERKYHNVGVQDIHGGSYCMAVSPQGPFSSEDRLYFRMARQTRQFAVGEYQVGRVTGRAGLNFGYPVLKDGEISGIAFLAFDLDEFQRGATTLPLPPQGVLLVLDRNGTILARQPADQGRIGMKVRRSEVLDALPSGGGGFFEGYGADGAHRLFAHEPVARNPDGTVALQVSISIPKHLIYEQAQHDLARDLLGILAVTVLTLGFGLIGVERLILRDIRTLLATANRVRSGDLTARTGMRSGSEELSQIGGALDDMVGALQQRDADLQRALEALREQATTDPLTGLFNRRWLDQHLSLELKRADRRHDSFAVLMVDADHFKRINDTYGHDGGDLVLTELAAVLRRSIRASDVAFRYGGEEFVVILSEAREPGARDRAEAIRNAIKGLDLHHEGRSIGPITASFGLAIFPDHGEDAETLLRAADAALYDAKAQGRDRVIVSCRSQ